MLKFLIMIDDVAVAVAVESDGRLGSIWCCFCWRSDVVGGD